MNRVFTFALASLFPFALFAAGTSDAAAGQKAAADALTAQSVQSKVITDSAGHVTHLAISSHEGFRKDKTIPVPEPISGETFRRVLDLPHLQAIALEHQKLGDADLALLGQLKNLRDVRLHYLWGSKKGGTATADAPLFINQLPLPLTVLELKHNFSIDGGCMDKLKPQPELVKLELDTGYATNSAVPFIRTATKLRNLQLHRTTIGDDQFQLMLSSLPGLEILEVRPERASTLTGASLRGLAATPKLQILKIGLNWKSLPFEDGLDVLVKHPGIRFLIIDPSDLKDFSVKDPAIQALHSARPDIRIFVRREALGGDPSSSPQNIDAEFNWDGGVTTHG
jgi:hypothetical protein